MVTPPLLRRGRDVAAGAALLVTALALVLAGCSSSKADVSGSTGSAGCRAATGGTFTLVAKNTKWNTSCITLSGTAVTFTIKNEDRGIAHNLNVMGAPGTYKTDLVPGIATQTLALKGLTPGKTYTYVCDLHPSMIGELKVT
jgi:plastocyanin